MQVAVIDYNAGNTRSVYYALQRIGVDAVFTNDATQIRSADKVIFPGVGEASTTMSFIRSMGLDEVIVQLTQPVLGICLGMQLLCRWSEENDTDCLGVFDLNVRRFQPRHGENVPHMGWNKIYDVAAPLFSAAQEQQHVYFVHSYFVEPSDFSMATCDYCAPFAAAISKDNFYATQFHPEKSGQVGAQILQNFLQI